jgi:3-phenylpropionate/trans-cinnamate dioxygenase ferredoxin reductase component
MSTQAVVIIGGGHASAQLCASLVDGKYAHPIHLVTADTELPYHRPPLSKAFIKTLDAVPQLLKPANWYEQAGIHLHLGETAKTIHRGQQSIELASGKILHYGTLIIATGTSARTLAALHGLNNVFSLRTVQDAQNIRKQIHASQNVALLGGGFIGLEIAATAAALGKQVQVFESAPRLLMRSSSEPFSDYILQTHRKAGIHVHLNAQVTDFKIEHHRLTGIECKHPEHAGDSAPSRLYATDCLLLGIGATPNIELAQNAGLECQNGISVNTSLKTSDSAIFAMGDCANFVGAGSGTGQSFRLESVQNANDQAKFVAQVILGLKPSDAHYSAIPWFWSEQGSMRLQMTGLYRSNLRTVRKDIGEGSFTLMHYDQEQLVCAESVNAAADHLAARKLIQTL